VASKKKKNSGQKRKAGQKPKKGPRKPGRPTPKSRPQHKKAAKAKKGKPPPKKAKASVAKGKPKKGPSKPKGTPPQKTKATAQKAAKAGGPATAPRNAKVKFSAPRAPKSTIRTPEGAEELKAKLGALSSAVSQIRSLKRSLNKSFYDIGQILREIRDEKLYEVKGYGSFEAFVEREIDLGKQTSLKIVAIVQTFLKEAALKAGLERLSAALDALEGDEEAEPTQQGTTASGTRSPIPFHKQ
jgi:hypothetical protein